MTAIGMHVEFLVEELSAREVIQALAPKILGPIDTFECREFQGKPDLLAKLPSRLRAYRHMPSRDLRIVVLVDEDRQNCVALKAQLEKIAVAAGLGTKSHPRRGRFLVVNRIAVEELEAWFFGDVEAIRRAYPRIPRTLAERQRYRDPDAIQGGTWEALEQVLKYAGHLRGSLPKISVARNIAPHLDLERNRSHSFRVFVEGVRALVTPAS